MIFYKSSLHFEKLFKINKLTFRIVLLGSKNYFYFAMDARTQIEQLK